MSKCTMANRRSWRVCNCAGCTVLLLGESMKGYPAVIRRTSRPQFVAGRVLGRPYCAACIVPAIQLARRPNW